MHTHVHTLRPPIHQDAHQHHRFNFQDSLVELET